MVELGKRIVFGTIAAVLLALAMSKVSRAINTAFVERQNATDRPTPQRTEGPQNLPIQQGLALPRGGHLLEHVSYNFCRPVRTLTLKDDQSRQRKRSPAMAAGLTDHIWSMPEWLSFPAVQHC